MKTLLWLVVILTGAFTYSSVLATAYPTVLALVSSVGTVRAFAYFALCVICVSALVVLRRKGRLLFGFLLIVLGGFFLGVASRSPSPSVEVYVGIGFTFFVVGYLIVRFESRRISIEVTEPLTPVQRDEAIKRLVEDSIPSRSNDSPPRDLILRRSQRTAAFCGEAATAWVGQRI